MAYNNIVIKAKTASFTDHTAVRTTINKTEDVQNGEVFRLEAFSTDSLEGEVWTMVTPTTGKLDELWMATSPEAPILIDVNGVLMSGLTKDKRAFINRKGMPIDAILLKKNDLIAMTGAGIANIATSAYLISEVDSRVLKASATAGAAGTLTLKKVRTSVYGQSDCSTIAPADTALYTYEVIAN